MSQTFSTLAEFLDAYLNNDPQGRNLSEVARAAKITPAYLGHLRRGVRSRPSKKHCGLIAEALRLDPEAREQLEELAGYGRWSKPATLPRFKGGKKSRSTPKTQFPSSELFLDFEIERWQCRIKLERRPASGVLPPALRVSLIPTIENPAWPYQGHVELVIDGDQQATVAGKIGPNSPVGYIDIDNNITSIDVILKLKSEHFSDKITFNNLKIQ